MKLKVEKERLGSETFITEIEIESSDYKTIDGERALIIPSEYEGKAIVGISPRIQKWITGDIKPCHLVISEGIKVISSCCFSQVDFISEITFPASISDIGAGAFKGMELLKGVYFSLESKISEIQGGVFQECASLEKVVLPPSITHIMKEAFNFCINLKEVNLSKLGNLKYIGNDAFSRTAIKEVKLSKKCLKIMGKAFSFSDVEEVDLSKTAITKIMPHLFDNCFKLKKVKLPRKITSIGACAFNQCYELTDINIRETNVREIGECAFAETGITYMELPDTVEIIDGFAFYGSQLENINIFFDAKYMGNILVFSEAFAKTKLKRLVIPDNVKFEGKSIFSTCKELETVVFRERKDCFNISNSMFTLCDKLRLVSFPANTSVIEYGALSNTNITKIDLSYTMVTEIHEESLPDSIETLLLPSYSEVKVSKNAVGNGLPKHILEAVEKLPFAQIAEGTLFSLV